MHIADVSNDGPARSLIRAHGFYRAMGLPTDLVLVDESGVGYDRPVRDRLENLVSASHLNRLRCAPGGVWILDGTALDDEQRRALERFTSVTFDGARDFDTQTQTLLNRVKREEQPWAPMDAGENRLQPMSRRVDNGFGGFADEGAYVIDVLPERLPPRPWCNILANDAGGMLLSEPHRPPDRLWQRRPL